MRDHNNDKDYTILIDSFNNKSQKGDDDFETWLSTEAPFTPTVDNITYSTNTSTTPSTITLNSGYTITGMGHYAPSKRKKLPIDILYKWYPKQMKEQSDD